MDVFSGKQRICGYGGIRGKQIADEPAAILQVCENVTGVFEVLFPYRAVMKSGGWRN